MSGHVALPTAVMSQPAAGFQHVHAMTAAGPGGAPHLELATLASVLALAVVYGIGAVRLIGHSRRQRGASVGRLLLFVSGYCSLAVAVIGPLDAAAGRLFAAHMLQHMVLIAVAAPLLILANPVPPMLLGLPKGLRRAATRNWRRRPAVRTAWRALTAPLSATALQLLTLYLWHSPVPFAAAADNDLVHAAMHASLLGSALLFWSSILAPLKATPGRMAAAICGAVLTLKLCGLLGLVFVVVRNPIYGDMYPVTEAWGLTVLEDQVVGGIFMMALGLPAYLGAALALLAVWLRRAHLTPGVVAEAGARGRTE